MKPFDPSLSAALTAYKAQLLRWNPQINLISRRSTEERIDSLFEQSLAGIGAVGRHLERFRAESGAVANGRLAYFDLGTGGGIPGIIWHLWLTVSGFAPQTSLVEPRSKRAWFLEKMVQLPDMPRFCVLADRWGDDAGQEQAVCPGLGTGEGEGAEPALGTILISLKALRLTDKQVLSGLCRRSRGNRLEGERVLIARYAPPDQELDFELTDELDLAPPDHEIELPEGSGRAVRNWIEALPGSSGSCASLVFSELVIQA